MSLGFSEVFIYHISSMWMLSRILATRLATKVLRVPGPNLFPLIHWAIATLESESTMTFSASRRFFNLTPSKVDSSRIASSKRGMLILTPFTRGLILVFAITNEVLTSFVLNSALKRTWMHLACRAVSPETYISFLVRRAPSSRYQSNTSGH